MIKCPYLNEELCLSEDISKILKRQAIAQDKMFVLHISEKKLMCKIYIYIYI